MELLKDKKLFFEKEGENIKQFYNMYQKKQKEFQNTHMNIFQNSIGPSGIQNHIVNIDDFKEYIYSWLTGTFTHSITNGIVSPFYYVELYACFFYFNYYYQSHLFLFHHIHLIIIRILLFLKCQFSIFWIII